MSGATMSLHALARVLGGEVRGGQILAPATGHSRRDRSLSVRFDARAPGGLLVHTFADGDPLAEKDRIRGILGLSGPQELQRLVQSAASKLQDGGERTARALAIWDKAEDPRRTPVQIYLEARGLTLPDAAAGEAIRFHPSCPFMDEITPAMVCLVRDILTNEPKAVHRTALGRDGCKLTVNGHSRLSLGPVAGGAIKLTPDEDVTLCLGIGEGLESSLSLQATPEFGGAPVWSLISAGGIERLSVLPGVESLWIAVDHDPTGLEACRSTAHRWQMAGREVFLITPSALRADLNDVIKGAPHA